MIDDARPDPDDDFDEPIETGSDSRSDTDACIEAIALPPRPAIWPVFVTFLAILFSSLGVQIVFCIVLLIAHGAGGADEMKAVISAPWPFMGMLALGQVCIGGCGSGAAWLS